MRISSILNRSARLLLIGLAFCLISASAPGQTPTQSPGNGGSEPTVWVGNMYPGPKQETTLVEQFPFEVYTQVYKSNTTESMGRAPALRCTLYWSEVPNFGGVWKKPIVTPMVYNGDIGNNDEYRVTLRLGTGLYEYTTQCTDEQNSITVWQKRGNGKLTISPFPESPSRFQALWLDQDTIAWNRSGAKTYELHYDPAGELAVPVLEGLGIPLNPAGQLSYDSYKKFPNIGGYQAWKLPKDALPLIPEILRGEIAIAAYDQQGKLVDATGIQIQGVLDAVYSYSGPLGVTYDEEGIPALHVWAPTAKSVTLHRYKNASPSTPGITAPMTYDPRTGVWNITGDRSWDRQYYQYEVKVYVPTVGEIQSNLTTDPYSVNLSQNSVRSQILDLDQDLQLQPPGWDALDKPEFTSPEDMVLYEVHVRDFSRDDPRVKPEDRGTFKAFTYDGQAEQPLSHGMSHLIELARAGLTHIHLMPAFDFTSVNEDPGARIDPSEALLGNFAANSDRQQAFISVTRGMDSFNWGYDPYHYGVPEGSYSTQPDDQSRVLEFREMVQTLNQHGLRVVMDMVYNHTFTNQLYPQSVLDKIVPGYYYRYTNEGYQFTDSCCPDTATEFDMMEKLMVDTLVRWAKAYKVDGFRFDLMNFHTVDNMIAVRDALQSLTLEQDGVDGSGIYIYGEGWDFGSAKVKGLRYANQYNMAGTGIGTFNDKIRDAIHGGASGDPTEIHRQGFINGQSYDWNGHFYSRRFRSDLRYTMDRLRIGIAGSLQSYLIQDQNNNAISGLSLSGSGYTLDPQETINYASKHDNETLFDLNAHKMPMGNTGMATTSMAERIRAQNLGLDVVLLSQGIPFIHMGADMLRSKSLDHNSYDSGDWFNRVDFTYGRNNFGVGLPPAWDNQSRWSEMSPLLTNGSIYPRKADILASVQHFKELLQIRRSSKLFRLETRQEIQDKVKFYNQGSNQKDGVIVVSIEDNSVSDIDPKLDRIVVIFNAHKQDQDLSLSPFKGHDLMLHPIQQSSSDPTTRTAQFEHDTGRFRIPARTTSVFVEPSAPEEEVEEVEMNG